MSRVEGEGFGYGSGRQACSFASLEASLVREELSYGPGGKFEAGQLFSNRLFRHAPFVSAFLAAKRNRSRASSELEVPIVYDGRIPIAFGRPSDWTYGIASRVLSEKLLVSTAFFSLPAEDGAPDVPAVDDALLIADAEVIIVGYESLNDQGGLSYQEDRWICLPRMNEEDAFKDFNLPSLNFFAVYDGHGGSNTADFVKANLHIDFANALSKQTGLTSGSIGTALRQAFKSTDKILTEKLYLWQQCGEKGTESWSEQSAESKEDSSGAAAVACVLVGRELVVAHLGDCRAALCRNGETIELTKDHTFHNYKERERVEQDGGSWSGSSLNGFLSVSRAFGDFHYTEKCKHKGLISEPDLKYITITDEDEFLLLCSDGLWDQQNGRDGFQTADEAVQFCRRQLRTNDNNIYSALDRLLEKATNVSMPDNTTAIIVTFQTMEQEPRIQSSFQGINFRTPSSRKNLNSG